MRWAPQQSEHTTQVADPGSGDHAFACCAELEEASLAHDRCSVAQLQTVAGEVEPSGRKLPGFPHVRVSTTCTTS